MSWARSDTTREVLGTPPRITSPLVAAFNRDSEYAVEIKHLWYTYQPMGFTALKDINLTIRHGEFLALIGQNGSGKTTLIKHMIGLHKATKGEVILGGVPSTSRVPAEPQVFRPEGYLVFHSLRENLMGRILEHIANVVGQVRLHQGAPSIPPVVSVPGNPSGGLQHTRRCGRDLRQKEGGSVDGRTDNDGGGKAGFL